MNAWKRAIGYSLLAIYVFTFNEWLFFVTKPSFLSMMSLPEALLVLFIAPLPYIMVALGVLAGLLLMHRTMAAFGVGEPQTPPGLVVAAYALVPALFLASTLFLVIDNFSYTMFGFGVIVARDAWRILYGILFVALIVFCTRVVRARISAANGSPRALLVPACGLLAASTACLLISLSSRSAFQQGGSAVPSDMTRPPDIFLISGDALEAQALPSYGNPFEEMESFGDLGPNTLVHDNSFPNANATAASTALVLTAKYATTTGKYHGYRFFSGEDAYQHLPGLLRARGYRSIQIGRSNHVNSGFWGMKEAFDFRNEKEISAASMSRMSNLLAGRFDWELHFSQVLFDQVWQRLAHVFGGRLMTQHHLIGSPGASMDSDMGSAHQIIDFLRDNPGPVLAQLHTMLTRNANASSLERFERLVGDVVSELKAQGRFRNSIIVIWSDHGQSYATNRRLPLIIKFPGELPPGTPAWNTQAIDIAPTILDILGSPAPSWMEGRSLLRPIDRFEPIFSSTASGKAMGIDTTGATVEGGLNTLGMLVCNRWYSMKLPGGGFESGWVEGHTTPCPPDAVPTDREASEMMLTHLAERGFDRSFLASLSMDEQRQDSAGPG
jgi:hypothetical protein